MTEKKKICFYASELAVLLGINKFKKPSEVLYRLWEYNFPDDIKYFKDRLKEKKKEVKENETAETKVKTLIKKVKNKSDKKKLEKTIKKCLESKDTDSLKKIREKTIKQCEVLDSKDKREIEKAIIELTNTNFGTKNEKKSIHIYTQLTGHPVIKINKFLKKMVYQDENFEYYIGGRIDGLLADRTIIEIKNRVHKLFRVVRDYEKVQTYCYMYVYESKKAELVETYISGNLTETNIMTVKYDYNYWKGLTNQIIEFTEYFNQFMNSIELKEELLLLGPEKFKLNY